MLNAFFSSDTIHGDNDMITEFTIQNYKAIKDATLHLTQMHVLIGPNNSGKTSILEAISAMCRSVDEPLDDGRTTVFGNDWQGSELLWNHNPETVRLYAKFRSMGISAERNSYLLDLLLQSPRAICLRDESIDGKEMNGNGSKETIIRRQRGNLNEKLSSIHDLLSGIQKFRWNPSYLALPAVGNLSGPSTMHESGFGLSIVLDDILGDNREQFECLENHFRRIFPEVRRIKLRNVAAYQMESGRGSIPTLKGAPGKGIYFEMKEGGAVLPASQCSDGLLLVLAYLSLLYSPDPPRVVAIEEPENGIHPKLLQQIITILRRIVEDQSHTQVILTTHSPYVLDMFKPEEVSLCQRNDDGSIRVTQLSNSKTIQDQIDVFSLGEIWTAEGDEKLGSTEG
ncbi:AAA family ATPase [Planctomycetota bacterium]